MNKIKVAKATTCPRCNSFIYYLPTPLDAGLAQHLAIFGEPFYPLDRFKVFKIETEGILIDSMIGRGEIRVKFKQNAVSMSALFRTALLEWVQSKVGAAEYIGA
jgi:hypothetical protein